jgi:cyclophilin family peptidyl-prolyl cis-trans isomerase
MSTNPVAIVETSMGTFKIELFADKAPNTVQNFIELVNRGFYKNMIFHRVVAGFVIQTGDPTGTGRGGSEKSIKLEIHPDLKHDRAGIVGMARSQDPDSATSQFYITLGPAPHLDGKYAIFGRVIEGLEVVMAIGQVEVGPGDRPIVPVELKSISMQQ